MLTYPHEIMNRAQAKEVGSKYYFTGRRCKNQHVCRRFTKNGSCMQCMSEATLRYIDRDRPRANIMRAEARERRREKDAAYVWSRENWHHLVRRAREGGFPCVGTWETLYELTTEKCPVFGTELIYLNKGKKCRNSATVDKIIPSVGYVPGNMVVISDKANTIKQNVDSTDLYKVAEWLANLEASMGVDGKTRVN